MVGSFPEKAPPLEVTLPKKPEGAKWADEPTILSRLQYRRDKAGWRPAGWLHLFVVDASGGTPRQVTGGDFDHGPGAWTADGKRLVFASNRNGRVKGDTNIFVADWVETPAAGSN